MCKSFIQTRIRQIKERPLGSGAGAGASDDQIENRQSLRKGLKSGGKGKQTGGQTCRPPQGIRLPSFTEFF